MRLAVPSGHRLDRAGTGPVPLAEVAGEPFLAFAPGYGLRGPVLDWCRAAGFGPRIAFEGGDASTLRGLVGAGLGVTLLPATTHPPTGETVEIPVPGAVRPIALVSLAGRTLAPPGLALRAIVRERYRTA